jgi:lipid-binding SYLF domain-containing protein
MNIKILQIAFVLIAIAIVGTSVVFAQNDKEYRKELRAAAARVDSASEVFEEVMKIDDRSIPEDILNKAHAIVVFPGTLKGAFIFGATGGKGVAVRKIGRQWSAPAFVNIGGGSIGFQIGGEKIDYILVIMNDEGLEGLLEDKFEIGGEASVAAGPVGRTTAASTNATLDASILSYSRSQGAFAGVSLKGAVIKQDKSMNKAIYRKSAKQLLIEDQVLWNTAPAELQLFPKTVAKFVRK